jgi:hypothetical protein
LCNAEPIIDAGTRKLPHKVFGFQVGRELPLTGKRDIMAVIKIYMALPSPEARIRISAQYSDVGLVTV